MMKNILIILALFCSDKIVAQNLTSQQYKQDFEFFWTTINDNYSYWDKKHTDWLKVKTLYAPYFDTVSSRNSFVLLLEKVFYEIYDHHASLNTNTMESQRLVPSGADIWAEFINGKPIVTEIRKGFGAEKTGMKAGMELIAFNDIPIRDAIKPFLPQSLKTKDIEADNYALRSLIAGNHSEKRKITVSFQNKRLDLFPDEPVNILESHTYQSEIESKVYDGDIGYIRINNNLGDNHLIQLFDSVLNRLINTKAMIIDMRETPGGGVTTVARSMIGRFISKEGFYQKHELPSEEKEFTIKRSWVEIVSPKKPVYSKPLVILVNHWTGSVAEGIAIGFDGVKRGIIIGTKMAGLNGANYSFTMPNSGIGFSFPSEKLFHVNGLPRENFKPAILVDVTKQKVGEDLVLQEGLKYLRKSGPSRSHYY